ncbi:MAG: hypothetical protein J6K16_02270 [Alphaproteobacteria bacterium]|nr:hypothetical protein [Alphaproteobacteria bacterium]
MGFFIHNHGRTCVSMVGHNSSVEDIKKEYGHTPFEDTGFRNNYKNEANCTTWTETRPIYYLSRKNELYLLGGIQYKVSKAYYEIAGCIEAQPAHYYTRRIMSAKKYKELEAANNKAQRTPLSAERE